ncbi:hypothetical protein SU32_16785 [Ahrensia marina]|uniref:Hydrolase n=2 Tax=Ahrensia marina TaxID=1514904 RepID=A0A0M9GL07_9HYPH|nr:hypothetical protein SU32_16785 [Ahrensia marina]
MYQLCTVDVWDTLLRRRCHPEAIKLAVARHVRLRYHSQLHPEMQDQWALYNARIDAELTIAHRTRETGHDDEYELKDVFYRWLSAVCPSIDADSLEAAVKELRQHELQVEIENTYRDEGILTLLEKYKAERVMYLSDFYMASDLLDALLAHHGLDAVLSGGLVSCDVGLNKRSGNLFRYIQEREGVPAEAHVHIGDNPHSDVYMPSKFGIKGVLYEPEKAHSERLVRNELFSSRAALFAHVQEKINSASAASAPKGNQTAQGMFLLGVQSAPLFAGLALFIAERSRLDNLDKLYFLTREGLFFLRVFQALFPENRHAGLSLPTGNVLAVSRIATFLASLNFASIEELSRIWRLNSQQKISTLLKILDLDPLIAEPFLKRHGLELEMVLNQPQEDSRVQALLSDKVFSSILINKAAERRALLSAYLEQEGATGGHIGIVDIGWRGTIQDNIALTRPDIQWSGYYVALRKFLNPQPNNTKKHAYVLEEGRDGEKDLFESFEPLELLCNCAIGSTISYVQGADETVIPLEDTTKEEAVLIKNYVRYFQDGVTFATERWAPFLSSHAVSSQEMRPLALKVWQHICNTPPSELVEAYYSCLQHDPFGFGGFFDRGAVPSLNTIVWGIISRRKRREVIHYVRRTQWSAALEGLPIGPIHKAALTTVFRIAKVYKRFVLMRHS